MKKYERNFKEDFRRIVSEFSEHIAVHDSHSDEKITYAALDQLINTSYFQLKQAGLTPGDTVASLLPDGLSSMLAFLACIKYGFNYLPLSSQSTASELEHYLKLVKPEKILIQKGHREQEVAKISSLGIESVELKKDTAIKDAEVTDSKPSTKPHYLYIATSGTTGLPKCLKIDADHLWSAACAFAEFHDFLDDKTVFFNFYPMAYLAGLFNLTLIPFSVGAATVLGEGFTGLSMMRFWTIVRRFGINVLWFSPTVLHGLKAINKNPNELCPPDLAKSMRAAFLGMGPISTTLKQDYERLLGFPLLENYALSETTFISSETLSNRFRRSEAYVGDLLPWVEAQVDAETNELQVKTPFLCEAEIVSENDAVKTSKFDPAKFWKTGDIAALDGQRLFYKGRIKHIVKRGGYLISLDEIERHLSTVEGLNNACVVGIEHPFYGECTVVCLTSSQREFAGKGRQHLAEQLSRYKWPSYFAFVNELPLTFSGKPDRKKLQTIATQLAQANNLEAF